MAASSIAICNLALSHLAVSSTIVSLTEKSKEAMACAAFYEQVINEVLRDFPWPFATVIDALALVEEQPTVEWAFSYTYPAGCGRFQRILLGTSAGRNPARDQSVPYRLVHGASGMLIYTDQETAYGEWITKEMDPTRYPPDLVQAAALLLATYIAPRVTNGDTARLGDRAAKLYAWRQHAAQVNAANEESLEMSPDSEFIRSRDA